jgi:hypothetical protein
MIVLYTTEKMKSSKKKERAREYQVENLKICNSTKICYTRFDLERGHTIERKVKSLKEKTPGKGSFLISTSPAIFSCGLAQSLVEQQPCSPKEHRGIWGNSSYYRDYQSKISHSQKNGSEEIIERVMRKQSKNYFLSHLKGQYLQLYKDLLQWIWPRKKQ